MSAGWPVRQELPPDTRPPALILSGLRRGALIVFLPVFIAGQAIAWLTYAVSGWYRPWSWFKIGLAQTLASVRVTFTSAHPATSRLSQALGGGRVTEAVLQVAIGALTVAVVVLAFRAGREQARGLERRPKAAAPAGATVGIGFALPMLAIALPVSLTFPQFDVRSLHPVLWQAALLPLVVGSVCGAAGGAAAARGALEETPTGVRLVVAARGGFTALWFGLALAFIGFLLLAIFQPAATGAYARFVNRSGGDGAVVLVQHALLLPNQSSMILSTSMGAPTTLSVGDHLAARITLAGIRPVGSAGSFLATLLGSPRSGIDFPHWYLGFLVVPAAATLVGGRRAGTGSPSGREALVRGSLTGVVYAALCGVTAWAAAVVLPPWAGAIGGSLRLGTDVVPTTLLALVWGVGGGVAGASLSRRWPEKRPTAPSPPR